MVELSEYLPTCYYTTINEHKFKLYKDIETVSVSDKVSDKWHTFMFIENKWIGCEIFSNFQNILQCWWTTFYMI